MTAAAKVPPWTYVSGHCSVGRHDACRGAYAGVECTCAHHTAVPEPADRPPVLAPAAQLTRAAIALDVDMLPMPPAAVKALAALLRAEGAWAADRGDTYPDDRAPLLALADLIVGGAA